MKDNPQRKTDRLLKGRASIPHARYFITICTENRQQGLTDSPVAELILKTWRRQHIDGDYILHCATIMPDHVHWLCTLKDRLSLSEVISKFKALTKVEPKWQRNYYDHRLRVDDAKERFSKYIFLNSYRRGLIKPSAVWLWWILNRNERPEFLAHLEDGKYPPAEWLQRGVSLEEIIATDS